MEASACKASQPRQAIVACFAWAALHELEIVIRLSLGRSLMGDVGRKEGTELVSKIAVLSSATFRSKNHQEMLLNFIVGWFLGEHAPSVIRHVSARATGHSVSL